LRPGISFQAARTQVEAELRNPYDAAEAEIFPDIVKQTLATRLDLQPVGNGVSQMREQFSGGLEMLMSGVALLLILACFNVAGMLLARAAAREQEIAVRMAIGAERRRVVRQLFSECLVLAAIGGFAGVLLSVVCLPLAVRALPQLRDRGAVLQTQAVHIGLDWRVLAFALAATLVTAVLFGLSPAWTGARSDLAGILRAARSTGRRHLLRRVMVVAQVAICTVVLIGAALLIRTFEHLRSMDPGFDQFHVLTFTVDPSMKGYRPEQTKALSRNLLDQVRSLAGVQNAAIASRGVMRGTGVKSTLGAAGAVIKREDFLNSSLNTITPEYFETMGMRIVQGRAFDRRDNDRKKPAPVIVNQALVKRFFGGRFAVGERLGSRGPNGVASPDNEIIGVVSDAKYRSLREEIPPTVYMPAGEGIPSQFVLNVRTRIERPEAMMGAVREVLRKIDPQLPFVEVNTLHQEVDRSLWQERLLAQLASFFGAIAIGLAALGLYGALDYAVKARRREIGIRVALGAAPPRIAGMLLTESLALVTVGTVTGIAVYAAAAGWIRRLLYGVRAWDIATIGAAIAVILLAACIAALPPVRRAIGIQPAEALHEE
jgi:predicted permease